MPCQVGLGGLGTVSKGRLKGLLISFGGHSREGEQPYREFARQWQ